MADWGPRSDRFRKQKVQLEGFIKLQRSIRFLGDNIFCVVAKNTPKVMGRVQEISAANGTFNDICNEGPVYDVIGYLLLLMADFDVLGKHTQDAYMVLKNQHRVNDLHKLTPYPVQPALPLSDYTGLAQYAGQLIEEFQEVLQEQGYSLATLQTEWPLCASMHERLETLRRLLTALV